MSSIWQMPFGVPFFELCLSVEAPEEPVAVETVEALIREGASFQGSIAWHWAHWGFICSLLASKSAHSPPCKTCSPDVTFGSGEVSRGQLVRGSIGSMALALAPPAHVPCFTSAGLGEFIYDFITFRH
jgi:hypothetical protein